MKIITEIIKIDSRWKTYKFINKNFIKKIVKNILFRFDNLKQIDICEFSIMLTNDHNMKIFNQQFRNIAQATNVLSFPNLDLHWKKIDEFQINEDDCYFGDIAFGYEIILKQSEEYNITFENHFIHLLIHSLLHLIGFDHVEESEAEIMEALEIEILQNFGIESPY